jgi:hypothetical protein
LIRVGGLALGALLPEIDRGLAGYQPKLKCSIVEQCAHAS